MKRVFLLLLVVAVGLVGIQAFASPPVKPPVEGFIIHSFTELVGDPDATGRNSATESESFNWTYFEGKGNLNAYDLGMLIEFLEQSLPELSNIWDVWNNLPQLVQDIVGSLIIRQGFQEGAEIAYEQTFEAKDGHTEFEKTFDAKSDPDPGDNNLVVNKKIDFVAADPTVGYANHTEKVGLSVVSAGGSLGEYNPAVGLLTLCPWAASPSEDTTCNGCLFNGDPIGIGPVELALVRTPERCDYPATNEGIAAGSSFNVTKLVGFESKSVVNSSINPALAYDVTAQVEGPMSAGFVVDLWEGETCWGQHGIQIGIAPDVTLPPDLEFLKDVKVRIMFPDPPPAVASRLHYEEHASVDGVWTFTKNVRYDSTMPGAVAAATFPFNQVP